MPTRYCCQNLVKTLPKPGEFCPRFLIRPYPASRICHLNHARFTLINCLNRSIHKIYPDLGKHNGNKLMFTCRIELKCRMLQRMAIVLSHISAAVFWESHSLDGALVHRRAALPQDSAAPSASEAKRAALLLPPASRKRMHILVASLRSRRSIPNTSCHLCSHGLPPGSLFSVEEGICVTSPEMTFVQMAPHLPLEHLVHFGMMLCGMYARRDTGTLLSSGRPPLTAAPSCAIPETALGSGPVPPTTSGAVDPRRKVFVKRTPTDNGCRAGVICRRDAGSKGLSSGQESPPSHHRKQQVSHGVGPHFVALPSL